MSLELSSRVNMIEKQIINQKDIFLIKKMF